MKIKIKLFKISINFNNNQKYFKNKIMECNLQLNYIHVKKKPSEMDQKKRKLHIE